MRRAVSVCMLVWSAIGIGAAACSYPDPVNAVREAGSPEAGSPDAAAEGADGAVAADVKGDVKGDVWGVCVAREAGQ